MSETQAPVAGADPRADGWRALAAWLDTLPKRFRPNGGPVAVMPHEDTRTLATALRAAAEAVTEARAKATEYRGHLRYEVERRQALERAVAGLRAQIETGPAFDAAARGAEGERGLRGAWLDGVAARQWTNHPPSADEAPRWDSPERARFTFRSSEWEAAADRYVASLAPRPSAGPAAGEEGPSGFDVGPVAYTNADALRDGLAARERAREREGAARASDGPAPTTEVCGDTLDTRREAARELNDAITNLLRVENSDARHNPFNVRDARTRYENAVADMQLALAAPAAPEVPRG